MTKKEKIRPIVTIERDCVPKDIESYKRNLKHVYDVCNEVIHDPSCFYTKEELEELKNNPEKQKELNIKFI